MIVNYFTGSYTVEDVRFLLKPMAMQNTPVHLKEALIQSGQKHYSELLTHEALPSVAYVKLFHQALALNQQRMAHDLLRLAQQIVATRTQGVTLVSLARAGTPIGVLLKHILKRYYKMDVPHYSVSIVRDIGLDTNALHYITNKHHPDTLVFVDGWTGKGVIARQLAESLRIFTQDTGIFVAAELYVLTDLSGSATIAASADDYLIPSCILNATVSGLVSRTVLDKNAAATDFHGCVYYQNYQAQDLSQYFINSLLEAVDKLSNVAIMPSDNPMDRPALQAVSRQFLQDITERYGVRHHNYIKPGIGEATRVLLRRKARLLLLRESHNTATQHLRWLAQTKSIPVDVRSDLPYQAAALIQEV
ncbi:cysteine protease StiP domain-containing protein [Crenothrix polyspora]|uniref:Cysteine protease StiP n=1 Tax=Crenothrix polyspora TaxID=360316 RepID=A0A1R4HHQ8_9GAMM|nr:cysteine protease StiP domain-containing protein [Crenothrix polyspora]SJM95772.1 Cysteine protease StiP [Crenothrix polyspora]